MDKILIIDDNQQLCNVMRRDLRHDGMEVVCAHNLAEGAAMVVKGDFDIVFLDLNLPDGDGLDLLPRLKEHAFAPEVIVLTGHPCPRSADLAITSGVWDYLQKPVERENLKLCIFRALEYRKQKKSCQGGLVFNRDRIIGDGPRIRSCLDMMGQAARSDVNVLITGETGNGKELFTQAIHENSARRDKNFVVVDCAVLPEALVEGLLFGYKKGAFTGATADKEGFIRQAHGGTLFLDEVGELPLTVQKKFLRVLQDHTFRPIGGTRDVTSDFRLIAATNRDLATMAATGAFREDLLFRLSAFTLHLPPLRERAEDIEALLLYYIRRFAKRYQIVEKTCAPEFLAMLKSYTWPGNVRELVNTIDRMFTANRLEPVLYARHLPPEIRLQHLQESIKLSPVMMNAEVTPALDGERLPNLRQARDVVIARFEKKYLEHVMATTDGNIMAACRIADIKRAQLYKMLSKYKIPTSSRLKDG